MNRIVVVYESKYGYTKRYAEWLGEALSCPVFERKAFRPRNLSKYETVIYGGGIYAGVISGIQFLRRNETLLSEKRCFCLPVGLQTRTIPTTFPISEASWKRLFREDSGADPALSSAGRDGLFPADFCTQVHDVYTPENAAQEG